jgi:WD40 repeat protein
MVTGSFDHTATVWDVDTGKRLFRLEGHTHRIFSVAVSSDGRWLATGSWDHTIRLWDAASYRHFSTLEGHRDHVLPVAFSRDSRRIISGSRDGVALVCDVESGRELLPLKEPHGIWSIAFSRIVTGNAGLSATVWDAATGKKR